MRYSKNEMFTWICPQCGREVPPSYNDCPDCVAKAQAQPPVAVPAEAPPAPQPPLAPQAPITTVSPALPPLLPTPARTTLPTWLMTVISALAFVGIGAAAFFVIQFFNKEPTTAARSAAPPENLRTAGAQSNPLMKQLEVAGLRLTQNKAKQTEVRFVIVNHSGAELDNLSGNIELLARTSKQDEAPVGAFSFKIPTLGPYESKEFAAVLKTKLKVYELPDWQNLDHRLEITSQ